MDRNTFDNFARVIGNTSTRRHFSGMLAALGLGTVASLSLLGSDEADAKKKRKRRKKRKKKNRGGAGDGGPTSPPPATCVPDCTGPFGTKYCGSDGCGGVCGTCQIPQPVCNSVTFTCEALPICIPDCTGPLGDKECGDDGCGGVCGTCSIPLPVCNAVTYTCEALALP